MYAAFVNRFAQNSSAGLISLRRWACTTQSLPGTTLPAPRVVKTVCSARAGVLFSWDRWHRANFSHPPLHQLQQLLAALVVGEVAPGALDTGPADNTDTARCAAYRDRSCSPAPPGRTRPGPGAPAGSGYPGRWQWSSLCRRGYRCGSPRRAHRGWWQRHARQTRLHRSPPRLFRPSPAEGRPPGRSPRPPAPAGWPRPHTPAKDAA